MGREAWVSAILHCAVLATAQGRLPEWPKGAVCKTVGLAYVGSNPTPATSKSAAQTRSGGPGLVRSGSGLKYRCRCLADRGDSASGQVGVVSPRPRGGLHSCGVARRG